ncbi:MAG TPA: GIY-YIG nuclease family protein [Patescibacteria group bacterium]|nr:GIY-YIG nuclease family protein [Patescibacteria group bacterium]
MSIPSVIKIKGGSLPETPGVYLMKNAEGKILYVGKAVNLKRRVAQYWERPHGAHIEEMVPFIREVDYIQKPTAIEALILEANLIKLYEPKYNIIQKDNSSFLYLVITKEDFPKPLLMRGHELPDDAAKKFKAVFGPYTSGPALRAALELVRNVFPWSTCEPGQKRPCFYVHLKQCPGVCVNAIEKKSYQKIIRDLMSFFRGQKEKIINQYKREMKQAAKELRFEEAANLRRKIFFLEHIQDVAIIKRDDEERREHIPLSAEVPAVNLFGRIEGYDISHISGTSSVASMVVFENGAPAKAEYRKFRIKTIVGSDDVGSLREVVERRMHCSWRKPDLLLIDGGLGQVRAVESVLTKLNLRIPVIGIAKGPERKRNDLICSPEHQELCALCARFQNLLERVRDEAHRFAISYHRTLRRKRSSSP